MFSYGGENKIYYKINYEHKNPNESETLFKVKKLPRPFRF